MNAYAEQAPPPASGPSGPDAQTPAPPAEPRQDDAVPQQEQADEPQEAHAARRELMDHAPGFIFGDSAAFGGSLVGGSQHGVSGGHVSGDVYLGGKTVIHQHGQGGATHTSGAFPTTQLDELAQVFVAHTAFDEALERLRTERVVVLTGAHATGRRAAALMLLRQVGSKAVRALEPDIAPGALRDQLGADGHVLCDLALSRGTPLREPHLLSVRERLEQTGGHLVITVERSAAALVRMAGIPWEPPPADEILRAHFAAAQRASGSAAGDLGPELLDLDPVRGFLGKEHPVGETSKFAELLASYAQGSATLDDLAGFGHAQVEGQVHAWLGDRELTLQKKAFLISLAVFDAAPYALAAELADLLYVELQRTEHADTVPAIPVFGPSPTERLELARAHSYEEYETTEWGPVPQTMAAYDDKRTARVLLTEVWTGHPSARPALVRWIKALAADHRPVVRTRAAAATAILAHADLPSAMAQLIEGWATARAFAPRLIAANALTLAHLLGAPAVARILGQWCTDSRKARRWTAIRGYALLAPLSPDQAPAALDAFAERARSGASSADERQDLAESAELLLVEGDRAEMLGRLATLGRQESPAVRDFVLATFVAACAHTDADGLLAWYVEEGVRQPDGTRDLAALWRLSLNDRTHTRSALDCLRSWLYAAEQRAEAEFALATLLPQLVVSGEDLARLSHLLRTAPGLAGEAPPQVAARLLPLLNTQATTRS